MPRHVRQYGLENRSARLRLPISSKPLFVKIGSGLSLGYRRNATSGSWVLRVADGKGGHWTRRLGAADDFDDADQIKVFDFWGAQDTARKLAHRVTAGDDNTSKLLTVEQAIDQYKRDLEARGGDTRTIARVRKDIPGTLRENVVGLVKARDLRHWRDGLVRQKLKPSTVNRLAGTLKAVLNLASDLDERIPSRRAWESGLATLPDATVARNVVLPEISIRRLVECAYAASEEFGLWCEVIACTGARPVQAARLTVEDLEDDRDDPRLLMPSSKKGRGKRKILRRPVPIAPSLAARLRRAVGERPPHAPLLLKPPMTVSTKSQQEREAMVRSVVDQGMTLAAAARKHKASARTVRRWVDRYCEKGMHGLLCVRTEDHLWRRSDHTRPFAKTANAAGLDSAVVTAYALRHSHITRQLIAGIPTRVANCDTSVAMLERTYSKFISDHSDTVARRAILDMAAKPRENVVPLRG